MGYELINWIDDDDITADRLNAMDNGIKTNEEELSKIKNNIPEDYIKSISSDGNDTLTVTKREDSTEDIKINNVEHSINSDTAIKAEQDSEGNVIKDSYLKTNGENKFNGTIWGDEFALKTTNGSRDGGIGIMINTNEQYVYLYNWGGKKAYLRCYGGGRVGPLQTDYQPDGTNDNELATCKYVNDKATGMDTSLLSILNQCYKKDPSGIIHQFIELEATTEEIDVQFPISFPEKCLFVGIEILNPQKDSSSNVKFETIEKGLDSVKLFKIGAGTPTISVMAVGI